MRLMVLGASPRSATRGKETEAEKKIPETF